MCASSGVAQVVAKLYLWFPRLEAGTVCLNRLLENCLLPAPHSVCSSGTGYFQTRQAGASFWVNPCSSCSCLWEYSQSPQLQCSAAAASLPCSPLSCKKENNQILLHFDHLWLHQPQKWLKLEGDKYALRSSTHSR